MTALMGAEVLLAPHQTGGCRSRSPRAMGAIDPALWERRPELYKPLAVPTGAERGTRSVRFDG